MVFLDHIKRQSAQVDARDTVHHGASAQVTENWMCGIHDESDVPAGRFTLETLRERFGAEQAQELMRVWQDNFITEVDFQRVKAMGFNCVRVPFSYRTVHPHSVHHEDEYCPAETGSLDFARMDWVVQQAARHGLLVVFCMHVWWGQERGRTSRGGEDGEAVRKAAYDMLTKEDEVGPRARQQRQHAVHIWRGIIEHFKNCGTIAAFELINEPYGGVYGAGFLYKALRHVDKKRLFLVWEEPVPETQDWMNVTYGPHLYEFRGDNAQADSQAVAERLKGMASTREDFQVPYFVGELHCFTEGEEEARRATAVLLEGMNQMGMSWAMWTYKGVDVGDWALVWVSDELRVDVWHDSADRIRDCWSQLQAKQHHNTGLQKVYSAALK